MLAATIVPGGGGRIGSGSKRRGPVSRSTSSRACVSLVSGLPESASRTSPTRATRRRSSRSNTTQAGLSVGSDTTTRSAVVRRNVRTASSRASRRGRNAVDRPRSAAGRIRAPGSCRADREVHAVSARHDTRCREPVRDQRYRVDDSKRARLGHDEPATRNAEVATADVRLDEPSSRKRPRLKRRGRPRSCRSRQRHGYGGDGEHDRSSPLHGPRSPPTRWTPS